MRPRITVGIRRPVIGHEMEAPAQQPLHMWITKVTFHRFLDDRQVIFIHDLINLNVERPVFLAFCQGNICLPRIDQPILSKRLTPDGLDNFDLWITDRSNHC